MPYLDRSPSIHPLPSMPCKPDSSMMATETVMVAAIEEGKRSVVVPTTTSETTLAAFIDGAGGTSAAAQPCGDGADGGTSAMGPDAEGGSTRRSGSADVAAPLQERKDRYDELDISPGEKKWSDDSSERRSASPPRRTMQEGSTQFRLSFNQGQQAGQQEGAQNVTPVHTASSSLSRDEEGGRSLPTMQEEPDAQNSQLRVQNGLIGDSLKQHTGILPQQDAANTSDGGAAMGDSPATVVTGHHQAANAAATGASSALVPPPTAVQPEGGTVAQPIGYYPRPSYGRTVTPPKGPYDMERQAHYSQRQMMYAMSPSPMQTPAVCEAENDVGSLVQQFPQDIMCAGTSADTNSSAQSSTPTSSSIGSSLATPPSYLLAPSFGGGGSAGRQYAQNHGGQQQHRGGGPVKPTVYSAIGSLESYNASSPGSLNSRIVAAQQQQQQQYHFVRTGPLLPPSGHASGSGLSTVRGAPTTVGAGKPRPNAPSLLAQAEKKEGERQSGDDKKRNDDAIEDHRRKAKDRIDGKEDAKGTASSSEQQKVRRSRASVTTTSHVENATDSAPILKSKDRKKNGKKKKKKSVKIDTIATTVAIPSTQQSQQQAVEMFRPSCDAYTPRMERKKKLEYKPAEHRTPVQKMSASMGTISRPNFRDALRRVAMILQQHIEKINRRFESGIHGKDDTGLFKASMRTAFAEENFVTPRYKCTVLRLPMGRPGVVYGLRKIKVEYTVPTVEEIYEFGHQLFKSVQLSSECSIVCLIYVERLMEVAKVPLLSDTWRPIFMCGLLLASKVWQDLSSWNIEFASVYPQFSLDAINRLELQFLKNVKWDLYISSSLYAKYYFALRSLLEKQGFRQRYNLMTGAGGVAASEALKIQKRTERVKEEALLQLSRSV